LVNEDLNNSGFVRMSFIIWGE